MPPNKESDYFSCDFVSILGGDLYSDETISSKDWSDLRIKTHFIQKIICFIVLLTFVIYHGYMRRKKGSNYWRNQLDNYVFYYLDFVKRLNEKKVWVGSNDNLKDMDESKKKPEENTRDNLKIGSINSPEENTNVFVFNSQYLDEPPRLRSHIMSAEADTSIRENSRTFIWDFPSLIFKFCCLCCLESAKRFYSKTFLKLWNTIADLLIQKSKVLCFVACVWGPFFLIQLNMLFSFLLLSPCTLKSDLSLIIYTLIDFILGSTFFFMITFIISFISTKTELLRIDPFNKEERGMIVLYSVKKAFIFGVFHCCIKVFLIFIYRMPINELSEGKECCIYWIMRNIFFVLSANSGNSRHPVPVENDDQVIKARNRFYFLQNYLLKYFPSVNSIFEVLNKQLGKNKNKLFGREDIRRLIAEGLKKKMTKNKISLENGLNLVESQKFKTIIRNRGDCGSIPVILFYYIFYFDIPLTLISCLMILLEAGINITQWCAMLMYVGEITLLPILISLSLKRTTLLGDENPTVHAKAKRVFFRICEVND